MVACITIVCIVSIGYLLRTKLQFNQQLIRISLQNGEFQKNLEQNPNADYLISEDQLAKEAVVYDCWVVTWSTPREDVGLNQFIIVWIIKGNLEIVEVQQICELKALIKISLFDI